MGKNNLFLIRITGLLVCVLVISLHTVYALETLIVSGTRFESSAKSMPGRVTVITAEEIALSGADHIVDVLRNTGGVQISDLFGDGTDANIGIRGFAATSAQNTLIMIDGRRLNNVDNSLPDLNTVSLKNIKKIEIIKGSMGTLYGDKAVGGVINIITRKPDGPKIQAEARYGSFNQRNLFVGLENKHDSGFSYRLSGYRLLNDNFRKNNALRLTDLSSKVNYKYRSGEVFFELQDLSENLELPGALFRDLLNLDRTQALNPNDSILTKTKVGRVGIVQNLMSGVDVMAEYTNRINNINGELSSAGNPQDFFSKRHHLEFTPRVNLTYPLISEGAVLTLGMDWFKTDYLIASDFGITDDTQTQFGYYAHFSIPVVENLTVTGGARHGKVKNDILVDTINFGRSLPEGSEIDDVANAWEFGFSYDVSSMWRVFGKLDKNYRFVTADEYSAIADNNFFSQLFNFGSTLPFPITQTGLSMELGGEWQRENNLFSIQLFQLDIDDEIVFNPVSFLNTNLGNTRRKGLILEGRTVFTEKMSVTMNFSYLDANYTSGAFQGNKLTFLSKYSGALSANYLVNQNFGTHLELYGLSDRQFGGDFSESFNGLPGYTVLNWNNTISVDNINLSFRINNLLDTRYSDSGIIAFDFRKPFPSPQVETYYPSPGRNYMLSIQYNYQ
ncbi:MAG: TonB-dependent receptor [Gammaproteobacteria bacterium]